MEVSAFVINGDTSRVKALLACGADPNARAPSGEWLLHVAVRDQAIDMVRALLEAGADANAKDRDSGDNALHLAAYDGYEEGIRLLLEYGGDATQHDADGERNRSCSPQPR